MMSSFRAKKSSRAYRTIAAWRFALISVGERGHQTLLLRLSAVLRNALVMCGKLIKHCNFFHKTTCPEFRPSLPPGHHVWTMEELLSYRVPPDFRDRLDQQATNNTS